MAVEQWYTFLLGTEALLHLRAPAWSVLGLAIASLLVGLCFKWLGRKAGEVWQVKAWCFFCLGGRWLVFFFFFFFWGGEFLCLAEGQGMFHLNGLFESIFYQYSECGTISIFWNLSLKIEHSES